ncbi:MAG TPA: FHA domain-containing protein [Verrucomicrobiae bacterium]
MKSVLTVLEGAGKGTSKPLTSALMIVGRSKNADLQVDDPLVSRRHLEIRVEGDAVFVENKSAQGSMLNGKPLTGVVSLNPGDIIEVGTTKMRFEEATEAAPVPKRAVVEEAEIDGTRIADPDALPAPRRKEEESDETRAMMDDRTRMMNAAELPNWQGQEKIEKKVAARGVSKIAIAGVAAAAVLVAVIWYFVSHRPVAGSTIVYKDALFDFSIDRPLDWSKTADDTGIIGYGFGNQNGNNWGRINIYTDKNPDFMTTGLTDGFNRYQSILKQRNPGFELDGNRKININGITVVFYEFEAQNSRGRGIYMLNEDTRVVIECVSASAVYSQYASQFTSIFKTLQLGQYVVQQFIDFPLPDESMQQLALSNPAELSHEVDEDLQSGKILYGSRDVSPDNLYKSIQEFRKAAQLSLAPPDRLPAYATAAQGLSDAMSKFDHALDEQRFQITSALKEGDRTRAYWEANKMMQMIPDKTDPAYQEAYSILQSLPRPDNK